MRFLKDSDYNVQIRSEIAKIIDNTTGSINLLQAEGMAIAQIRNHIAGRYDCNKIFTPAGDVDTRDQYIVMIVIDLALYHLWSKEGPNNIPKTRELRYEDALKWLTAVQKGQDADLPALTNESGEEESDIRIWSEQTKESNRF